MTGIGLSIRPTTGTGAVGLGPAGARWRGPAPLLDADFVAGAFRFAGTDYPDKAGFLAGIGGQEAGGAITVGPYVAPDAPELIANGDFASGDLSSWTPILNGTSTATRVAQGARLVSDGTTGTGGGGAGVTQGMATQLHHAYRVAYRSSVATMNFRIAGLNPTAGGPAGGTRPPGQHADTFSARGAVSYLYAFRIPAGTAVFEAASLKACAPLPFWSMEGVTVDILARTPATLGGTKVLWSCGQQVPFDPGDDIEIFYTGTGRLRMRARAGEHIQADIDLGAVPPDTLVHVRAGFGTNGFFGQVDGGITAFHPTGVLVGLGVMRIGANGAGNVWDGAIERVTLHAGAGPALFHGLNDTLLWCEGDGVIVPPSGIGLGDVLEALSGRTVIRTAASGSSMSDIATRILHPDHAHLRAKTLVVWDGSENPVTQVSQVAAYCDALGQAIRALGHKRFVLIPACANAGQTDLAVSLAIRDQFMARWPGHVIDWRDHLDLDGNGAPAPSMFVAPATDPTRLSQVAMDRMAAAIVALLADRGW